MTFLCREFCVHHTRPSLVRLSSLRTPCLALHEGLSLIPTRKNLKRGFQRRRSRGSLRRETSLQASWVEPVIAIGIPTLFASLFGWSLTELQKLRSQIRGLESTNEDSRQLLEQSESTIEAQGTELTSLDEMTTKQESPEKTEEISRLKDEIARLNEEWSADQNRVRVLEKARAAAVKDVTIALASKREAEFKLKDAKDRTTTLSEELTLKNVKTEELEGTFREERECREALEQQENDLEEKVQDLKEQNFPSSKMDSKHEPFEQDLIAEIQLLKDQLRRAQEEAISANEDAKLELKLMTEDLIRVRDQKTLLAMQAENLTIELSKSEDTIKALQSQLSEFKITSIHTDDSDEDDFESIPLSENYLNEMRADAALLVEEIEDKAQLDLEHAMKLSQSAEKAALEEVMKAAKEKEHATKLKRDIDRANHEINDKQKEIWYLKDKIRVLYSDIEHLTKRWNQRSDNG